MEHRVLLLLGAGQNIGLATITTFKAQGYKVASVSRTPSDAIRNAADLVLTADFSEPSCISDIFKQVETTLGIPNTVIYNGIYSPAWSSPISAHYPTAYSWAGRPTDRDSPVTAPLHGLQQDLAVNTTSVFAATQAAVAGFVRLPEATSKTFIFTGNRGAAAITPAVFTLGLTKAAAWYMIQMLVAAYQSQGYKFYFVDERTPEGKGMIYVSGEAHAEMFLELTQRKQQGEAFVAFVRGKGEIPFESDERAKLPVMSPEELVDFEYGKPDDVEGFKW
jgi:NAD(P)-dependent dehydrogenase (short-subunit alcohol dehydrogenase family)